VRGDQQRLTNGNTLITESEGGRILEIAPDGEIVWEFINPVRNDDGTLVSIVCFGTRIDPASLEPDFRATIEQGGEIS
jgi:archaeosine-15-forming tRNA-guanine transglycosylase